MYSKDRIYVVRGVEFICGDITTLYRHPDGNIERHKALLFRDVEVDVSCEEPENERFIRHQLMAIDKGWA